MGGGGGGPEVCERLDFPTWGSSMRPCWCCSSFGAQLYEQIEVTSVTVPWHEHIDDDWETACARCEKCVTVADAERHKELYRRLAYDKARQRRPRA